MKYKKLITITLVSIITFTSISSIAMAKNTYNETRDFEIKSVFRGKIFDFITKLSEAFPILGIIINRVTPEMPSEPHEPDTDVAPPKLKFDISIGEIYTLEEPIIVEATLTNVGSGIVHLSEMNFNLGTLDYFIRTPEGYELHYIGFVDYRFMLIWTLHPEESRSVDIDIKCGDFGKTISGGGTTPGGSEPYKFIPGVYSMRAQYKSFYPVPTLTSELCNIWHGTLETVPYFFEIVERI